MGILRESRNNLHQPSSEPNSPLSYWLLISLFLATNLHLLRNLNVAYYGGILILWSLLVLVRRYRFQRSSLLDWYIVFFLSFIHVAFISCWGMFISDRYPDAAGILLGLARLLFVLPLAVLAAGRRWELHEVSLAMKAFAVFVAVGALSVPLQFLIGPISWFVEASTRSGFDRFGSLFGNLTALGIVGGLGIISAVFSNFTVKAKALIVAAIIIGLLLSLQKAAVANAVVAAALVLYYYPAPVAKKAWYVGSIALLSIALIILISIRFGEVAWATLANFRLFEGGEGIDDYTVMESVVQRIVELPLIAIEHYGWPSLIWGVGVIGIAGVAGYEDAPMSHNLFADLILMGGVIMLIPFVAILWTAWRRIHRRPIGEGRQMVLHYAYARATMIYVLINMPFASGVVFQPNIGAIFWLLIGIIMSGYFVSSGHESRRRRG